ncbi:MAG: anti-anti-sigma factor [Desulfosporosinus sp. BRH_c37]|nr:MAG: anti-anti-sigma factor [Desulfosporosinus sp. BRH_c37]
MKYSIKVCGNQATVYLREKIFVQDTVSLRADLIKKIDRGITDIRINLSELTYIDGSGLGVLVTINNRTKENNGKLILTNAQGLPLELIMRTRLDKAFIIEN